MSAPTLDDSQRLQMTKAYDALIKMRKLAQALDYGIEARGFNMECGAPFPAGWSSTLADLAADARDLADMLDAAAAAVQR